MHLSISYKIVFKFEKQLREFLLDDIANLKLLTFREIYIKYKQMLYM